MAASIYPVQMMTRLAHSGAIDMDAGFNASVITTGLSDIVQSVQAQAAAPCYVALTFRYSKDVGEFNYLYQYWLEVQKHPNIKWVYVYDELFWEQDPNTGQFGVQIGAKEAQIENAARLIHSVGLKPMVSILPQVIMDANFAANLNAFDVIGIDLYPSQTDPSILPTGTSNAYLSLLDNCIHKLRGMGYTGDVWYVFQAFGDTSDADLTNHLTVQRDALAHGPEIGIVGAVSFGYYDVTGTNLTSPLYQGHGSSFESLVMP